MQMAADGATLCGRAARGSGRTVALQPISLKGSVAIDVALGVSALTLRPVY